MLINGEKEIGVSALHASEKYDEGNVIRQESLAVQYPIKINDAIDLISKLYSTLVLDIYRMIINNENLIGIPQLEENATYSLWRDNQDYIINWNNDSQSIKRMIDAVGYPFSGATTLLNNEKVIIEDVEVYLDLMIENRDVGKVIFIHEGYPIVVCGKGLLKIKNARFVNGNPILPLQKFRSRFGGQPNDTL